MFFILSLMLLVNNTYASGKDEFDLELVLGNQLFFGKLFIFLKISKLAQLFVDKKKESESLMK